MHPDLPSPDLIEQLRSVAKGGPAWWVYALFVILSFLGATLGFQYVAPSERIAIVETVNARQDSVDRAIQERLNRDDDRMDAILALLCVNTTDKEHRLARVTCPTGRQP